MITYLRDWVRSDKSTVMKNVLRVAGAYGIIQVFAQDIGIRTGCKQGVFSQNMLVQWFLFISVAYSVTDDFFQSLSGALIYFVMKYAYSQGRLNDVCVPNECDNTECRNKS